MEQVKFHVISHTHWDREWYLPFEAFRLELVELIDNLLNILEQNNNFIFHLDGQSIILQDYLEIKPYNKEKIKKWVQSGNLLIGPYYVLSDEFLISGEAAIRNLIYGIRIGEEIGSAMLIGYLPDQFGHITQLPQILRGFNINSAIVGRGIQDSLSEHIWYGLNGENITAVSLTHWYNNAQRLPENKEDFTNYIEKIYKTQINSSISKHILLMNGCDHLFPQENLSSIINGKPINEKWKITQDSLTSALKEIAEDSQKGNYPICFGELRDDNNKYILAGTLSSRVYLKLANYELQTKTEKIVEPLSTFLTLNKKITYPYDELKYAWRLLIQNHAHDSICGCSTDEVHKEMEMRFLKVKQVVNKLQETLLSSLQDCRGVPSERPYLQLINLTNYKRNEIVEADLEFPLGPPAEHSHAIPTINKEEIKNILLKQNGKIIGSKILDNNKTHKMVRSKNEVPLLQAIQRIKILFETNLEPFSITSYEVETSCNEMKQESKDVRKQGELEFKNEFYSLKVNKDGTVSMSLKNQDQNSNNKFENLHFITIEDDLGDEYNFVPNKDVTIINSKDWEWDIKVIEENDFRKKFSLIAKFKTQINIEIEITCYKNFQRIDFKTKVNNDFKNKRIRIHFPTNLGTNYIFADTPFGVLQRARPPVDWINYATTQPLHNWIDHSNSQTGLAFFGGGLADYELYENGNGFSITLIRAVGRLSSVKSHSLIETKDAQCNREIIFSYSILPHFGNWENQNIEQEQLIFQTPLLLNQSNLQINSRFFQIEPKKLVLSCLKRSEEKENIYILRLFNPSNKKIENCSIKFNFSLKRVTLLNLNEEFKDTINKLKDHINFEIGPHQILTFGLEKA